MYLLAAGEREDSRGGWSSFTITTCARDGETSTGAFDERRRNSTANVSLPSTRSSLRMARDITWLLEGIGSKVRVSFRAE